MEKFGIPCCVTPITAITPQTVVGPGAVTPATLAQECAAKSTGALPYGPFHVGASAFSTTLSHVKALKRACERPDHKDILVVLEDDARLEPMAFWPASLTEMVRQLPTNWKVVNAACSNKGWPRATEMFRNQTISQEFGAVAVMYNLANPAVCAKVNVTPLQFVRKASEMCAPADTLIYVEISEKHQDYVGAMPYTTNLPLFYFSGMNPNKEEKMVKDASHNSTTYEYANDRWATAQRMQWLEYWKHHDRLWQDYWDPISSCRKYVARIIMGLYSRAAPWDEKVKHAKERAAGLCGPKHSEAQCSCEHTSLYCSEFGLCGHTAKHKIPWAGNADRRYDCPTNIS